MSTFDVILPFLKPIEHLILDDSVSEVMVNGPHQVFVERDGFLQEVPDVRLGERSLLVAVKNIARCLGGEISESKPILDSRLPDGSRVAVVIPPFSLSGVTLTIRKFNVRQFGIADLILAGMLNPTLAKRFEGYVLARKNILISGGTGAGKSTLLSMLARFIPEDERIVLIEDRPEIQIIHKNVLRFEPKQSKNGRRPTTMRDLLEAAMGHRPDRIVVGDLRGGEAFDLLELMNAGHSGTLAAVHANGALQALARFTSCVLRSGTDLPYRALKSSIADSLNVVVQMERRPGRRYISEILEINTYDAEGDFFNYCSVYQNLNGAQRLSG
jgi:pilus assembly protein CpaF